ncbi:aerobic-type carbon monoxide dehydrogenase small subunit (CoxS/CutS family) [Streptomyces sp. KhCrAH-43]|uniref:2Fe-2S iron-sulfur cluster-binding protein n=1 Tax=unclassified Streptomyces TaxID=2593676 RepID=UPI00038228CD|nr:(2Fe-2S)-binding protein [Streptomyces sp. KhCrAH-43]MYS34506.1 2Fe-2S iron-sulfur cluster binding domain-containing protein [Streptomyces sp. SID4920]MYX65717.1 2Fe-2S iron-sulfur cluster binding domain-containing protein [Streptomyces sp. SID8373]RAJ64305.1 aerobic-type carbon monoxide dehydrogenase small subunit (CoxS/CutS family) [Streptomyces sp. KhCrAH-43]
MSKENPAEQHGGWQPTPQGGDYDGEATAFVHLPPEDLADIPLAAPGHGYTPPMILPLTPAAGLDPAATGNWVVQTPEQPEQQPEQRTGQSEHSAPEEVHWPDPNQQSGYGYPHPGTQPYQDPYAGDPAATGQWSADTGTTASWPAAAAPLPDDSGELYTAPPVSDWYADRPATLPGGAPAPWAVTEPAPEPGPEAPADVAESAPEPAPYDGEQPVPAGAGPDAEAADQEAPRPETGESGADPVSEPSEDTAESVAEPREAAEPVAEGFHPEPAHTDGPHPGTESDADPGTEAPGVSEASEAPEADDAPLAVVPEGPSEHPAASYVLHVNGVDRPVTDAWIGESLLYVLRERLGLAGAKDGCSQGECGACNVQVDGRLVASCLVPAATTAGSEVRTVEGLAVDGEPSDVQRALANCGAVQCGFCIPGMAMTVHDLLEGNHRPSELETRRALCGNLCRCSGYRGVLDAVNEVIAGREAAAEAAAEATGPEEPEEARIPHQAGPGAGSVQAQQQDGGMA